MDRDDKTMEWLVRKLLKFYTNIVFKTMLCLILYEITVTNNLFKKKFLTFIFKKHLTTTLVKWDMLASKHRLSRVRCPLGMDLLNNCFRSMPVLVGLSSKPGVRGRTHHGKTATINGQQKQP